METSRYSMYMFFAILMLILTLPFQVGAQQIVTQSPQSVPRLINFSGRAVDVHGKPIPGVTGVTFAIFKDQSEGSPLWMETQNVQVDAKGNYTAQLGATKAEGLPLELFSSGEGRWLGVRTIGGEEQPRVLLLSVPYALKAEDARTLGGLPPSAFVLAASPIVSSNAPASASGEPGTVPPPNAAITGLGTVNAIPLWDGVSDIVSSAMTQTGAGTTARIGINTITPTSTLDVKGSSTFRGVLALPAIAPATTAAGKTSQPLNLIASSFNTGIGTPVNQTFRLLAEPLGNNTASTGGTLNLLYGSGANAATETGLKIASNGRISFAAGQTFPGVGSVISVGLSAPGADFTVSGSPVNTSGTLGFNWKVAPTTAATANAIVKRDGSGGFSAGVITAGRVSVLANSNVAAVSAGNLGSSAGVTGSSANSYGVVGLASNRGAAGVIGNNDSTQGIGVEGQGGQFGVYGTGDIAIRAVGASYGVYADSGVYGVFGSGSSYGVWGETSGFDGVHALAHGSTTAALGALNDGGGDAIYAAVTSGGLAGFFLGDVQVAGNLSKSSGSFKIDHPLDPANKYLYHSFVESPDMMNIYNGNVTTDAAGHAVVRLPEWFESLNRDFRYQLTVIGQFAQAIVASEVADRQFSIRTDKPNVKVSWQVTGIRQDAWANAHRIPVEQAKPERERGSYLHPELFGAPKEKSIGWLRHPESMKPHKPDQSKIPALKETGLLTPR